MVKVVRFNDGTGPRLFAFGTFTMAGGQPATGMARWNGLGWVPIATALGNGFVMDAHVFPDGIGTKLIVAGQFSSVGGVQARNVACWDGASWSALGGGVGDTGSIIRRLRVLDLGAGPRLFAVGDFNVVGSSPTPGATTWNGTDWTPVGGPEIHSVTDLAVFDTGFGPRLIAAGEFGPDASTARGAVFQQVGAGWSVLGTGTEILRTGELLAFDDGSGNGRELYVTGIGITLNGVPAGLLRWNNQNWRTLGDSVKRSHDLHVHDDGSGLGDRLYSAGRHTLNGTTSYGVAVWDGTAWEQVGDGQFSESAPSRQLVTLTLASWNDGQGPALYVGGEFGSVGALIAPNIVASRCTPVSTGVKFCFGNGGVIPGCTPCPCGNNSPSGSTGGCLSIAGTGAVLEAFGSASISADALSLRARLAPPGTFGLLFSATGQLPASGTCPPGSGVGSLVLKGLRCIAGNDQRHGTRGFDGLGTNPQAWGYPGPSLAAQLGSVPGQTRSFQVFYRDLPTLNCMREVNTTNGVSITFEP